MPSSRKSTILAIQASLLKRIDPDINVNIYDETLLVASRISEAVFKELSFVTNNPSFNNSYMYVSDIKVYVNNVEEVQIYGLLPIVQQRVENSDSLAFTENKTTHKPFLIGFQDGKTVGEVVDTLSSLSRNTPDTYGMMKTFTLYIDPPLDKVPEY